MTDRRPMQRYDSDTYDLPDESLKKLLAALCGVSIDYLVSTPNGNVRVFIANETDRALFKERFAVRFNVNQEFDRTVRAPDAEFKPFMYDAPPSKFAPRDPVKPGVDAAFGFLDRLIPPSGSGHLAMLKQHLSSDTTEQDGVLTSKWCRDSNDRVALTAAIARIGSYFSYVSLQRIEHCFQRRGEALPERPSEHVVRAMDEKSMHQSPPIAQTQTPFLTAEELHEKIFRVEHGEDGYRLVFDVRRLDNLTRPLRIAEQDQYLLFNHQHFTQRIAHFATPYDQVLLVDGKPVFLEEKQSSGMTVRETKGRVHFVLDYSGSMGNDTQQKNYAAELTKNITQICTELLRKNIEIDITYFHDEWSTKMLTVRQLKDLQSLPTEGEGYTPLLEAMESALKQTRSNDLLIVFTDGVPTNRQGVEVPFRRLNHPDSTSLPSCYFYGCGGLDFKQVSVIAQQWREAGMTFESSEATGQVNIEDFTKKLRTRVERFCENRLHNVRLHTQTLSRDYHYRLPTGLGPILAKAPIVSSNHHDSVPRSASGTQEPIVDPRPYFWKPRNWRLGDDSYVAESGGFWAKQRKNTCQQWLERRWKQLQEDNEQYPSFCQKMWQLLHEFSTERFLFQKATALSDMLQRVSARDSSLVLMTHLLKMKAPTTEHPLYTVQNFLREWCLSRPNYRQDLPVPTLASAAASKFSCTPATISPCLLFSFATVLAQYRTQKIEAAWAQLAGWQKTDEGQWENTSSNSPLLPHDGKAIGQLFQRFVINLGFFAQVSVWLAGYRKQYKEAARIITKECSWDTRNTKPEQRQALDLLMPLLPQVGKTSYLHRVVFFLNETVVRKELSLLTPRRVQDFTYHDRDEPHQQASSSLSIRCCAAGSGSGRH